MMVSHLVLVLRLVLGISGTSVESVERVVVAREASGAATASATVAHFQVRIICVLVEWLAGPLVLALLHGSPLVLQARLRHGIYAGATRTLER